MTPMTLSLMVPGRKLMSDRPMFERIDSTNSESRVKSSLRAQKILDPTFDTRDSLAIVGASCRRPPRGGISREISAAGADVPGKCTTAPDFQTLDLAPAKAWQMGCREDDSASCSSPAWMPVPGLWKIGPSALDGEGTLTVTGREEATGQKASECGAPSSTLDDEEAGSFDARRSQLDATS